MPSIVNWTPQEIQEAAEKMSNLRVVRNGAVYYLPPPGNCCGTCRDRKCSTHLWIELNKRYGKENT